MKRVNSEYMWGVASPGGLKRFRNLKQRLGIDLPDRNVELPH